MGRLAAVLAGGTALAGAAYIVSSDLLRGETRLLAAALLVVFFAVGAFVTNLILDWLRR
jgi:hypothetical protein